MILRVRRVCFFLQIRTGEQESKGRYPVAEYMLGPGFTQTDSTPLTYMLPAPPLRSSRRRSAQVLTAATTMTLPSA